MLAASKLLSPSALPLLAGASAACCLGGVSLGRTAAQTSQRGLAAAAESPDRLAKSAAAGAVRPGDEETGMQINYDQNDSIQLPSAVPDSELPPIGGYGEDPVAAAAEASDADEPAREGASGEVGGGVSGAMSAASEAAHAIMGTAASAARGATEATSAALPGHEEHAEVAGNVPARGEAPGTSGHAMGGWPRWKKEADDAMQGGTPEPGIVIE